MYISGCAAVNYVLFSFFQTVRHECDSGAINNPVVLLNGQENSVMWARPPVCASAFALPE